MDRSDTLMVGAEAGPVKPKQKRVKAPKPAADATPGSPKEAPKKERKKKQADAVDAAKPVKKRKSVDGKLPPAPKPAKEAKPKAPKRKSMDGGDAKPAKPAKEAKPKAPKLGRGELFRDRDARTFKAAAMNALAVKNKYDLMLVLKAVADAAAEGNCITRLEGGIVNDDVKMVLTNLGFKCSVLVDGTLVVDCGYSTATSAVAEDQQLHSLSRLEALLGAVNVNLQAAQQGYQELRQALDEAAQDPLHEKV